MQVFDHKTGLQFIFWADDLFPYTIGAKAVPRPNGRWYVPSYQMTVTPLMVYPLDIGQDICDRLQNLTEQHRGAMQALTEGFNIRLGMVAPFVQRPR